MEVVGAGDPAHDENDASILSQYLPALWPARRLVKRHEIASAGCDAYSPRMSGGLLCSMTIA